jgi:hypothetical protein
MAAPFEELNCSPLCNALNWMKVVVDAVHLFSQCLDLTFEDLIHFANFWSTFPLFDCIVSVHVLMLPNRFACDSISRIDASRF